MTKDLDLQKTRANLTGLLAFSLVFGMPILLHSQEPATQTVSQDYLKQILERLDRDERQLKEDQRELKDLHNLLTNRVAVTVPNGGLGQTNNVDLKSRLEKDETAIADVTSRVNDTAKAQSGPKYPNIQFHGFGDVDYGFDNRKPVNVPGNTHGLPSGVSYDGIKNTFYLGELDFFVTSQLSDKATVVTEDVVAAGSDNHTGWDIERLYFEYRFSDWFIADMGRFHTDLGYYNSTYHHGTWLQTAEGRPSFLQFEDSGGIMPVHMVGLSLHGAVPSGSLNLGYFLELGNGEDFSANQNLNSVQQLLSRNASKAVNVGLAAKPDWLPGLQLGTSFYFDSITPDNSGTTNIVPRNNQYIFCGDAVYHNANWEFLNEGFLIVDKPVGGQAHYNPAFYTQVSRKFGCLTPYARFTYYKIALGDTLYTVDWASGVNAGSHYGPSLGLRYDFTTYAAAKLQYDYLIDYGYNDASRLNFQVCFTF